MDHDARGRSKNYHEPETFMPAGQLRKVADCGELALLRPMSGICINMLNSLPAPWEGVMFNEFFGTLGPKCG